MIVELDPVRVLVLSILVLWLGAAITSRVALLRRLSIPIAVTGGILCSLVVALLDGVADVYIKFDLSLRDTLLLVFFSTIGLSAKLALLKEGGRTLAILGGLTLLFLTLQNGVGVLLANLMGAHWGFGLIAGSVSLAGGHGTAITWGEIASGAGLTGATTVGLAFATFGLISGGIVGGPLANHLIRRDSLAPREASRAASKSKDKAPAGAERFSVTSREVIRTLLMLAICIEPGSELNRALGAQSIVLPGFLTAMGVGILLTNLADLSRSPLDAEAIDLFNSVSLHLFLAMSLMSMHLLELAGAAAPAVLVLTAQIALAIGFAVLVVYRFCGRDYDAAVISAGYAGLCLGATPVGIANMNAVTSRFGACPRAFIVVPLVGAFLLDIINAFVIQTYIQILG
jgi:ESS family glutamate:Na+ symporter